MEADDAAIVSVTTYNSDSQHHLPLRRLYMLHSEEPLNKFHSLHCVHTVANSPYHILC